MITRHIKKEFKTEKNSVCIDFWGRSQDDEGKHHDELGDLEILRNFYGDYQMKLLQQVHGANSLYLKPDLVLNSDHHWGEYDAVYCTVGKPAKERFALVIKVADCMPIAGFDLEGTTLLAIHGGWRGLHKNIIANTMADIKQVNNQFIFWLGPHIKSESYEVGSDVFNKFEEKHLRKHPQADKRYLNMLQIAEEQIKNNTNMNSKVLTNDAHDTFIDKKYFSHRRGHQGRNYLVVYAT